MRSVRGGKVAVLCRCTLDLESEGCVVASHDGAAIRIICGARGGRCGRQLGIAKINWLRESAQPVMILSNEGWAISAGYPLLEDSVPSDFSGSTGILGCPDHGFLITERSGDPPIAHGFPRGRWLRGCRFGSPSPSSEGRTPNIYAAAGQ